MPLPELMQDCIRYADRDIMVVHNVAFYRSTGTNTTAVFKNTWLPMLGMVNRSHPNPKYPEKFQGSLCASWSYATSN